VRLSPPGADSPTGTIRPRPSRCPATRGAGGGGARGARGAGRGARGAGRGARGAGRGARGAGRGARGAGRACFLAPAPRATVHATRPLPSARHACSGESLTLSREGGAAAASAERRRAESRGRSAGTPIGTGPPQHGRAGGAGEPGELRRRSRRGSAGRAQARRPRTAAGSQPRMGTPGGKGKTFECKASRSKLWVGGRRAPRRAGAGRSRGGRFPGRGRRII
jgi:hypothetical protein